MESLKVDEEEERELRQKEIEKHCRFGDATNPFFRDLCRELGKNAEVVVSRLFEKHYKDKKDERKLWIKKWDDVARNAKNRSLGIEPPD